MKNTNLQTWTRITRFDLQHLAVSIGNAAVEELKHWPSTGEGRQVKATAERIQKLLDRTLDRGSIDQSFNNLEEVLGEINHIRELSFYKDHISNKLYQDRRGKRWTFDEAISRNLPTFSSFIAQNRPTKISVETEPIRKSPQNYIVDSHASLEDDLGKITPTQKPAPLQFEVRNGVLQIKHQVSRSDPEYHDSLTKARLALADEASLLIDSLAESNCDPRLAFAIINVRDVIASDADVIRLGILNLTCERLASQFSDQLPDVVNARLQGLSVGMNIYVSQFPEWERFIENAARIVSFNTIDIELTHKVGTDLVTSLKQAEGLVDPEVPKSVELLLEALHTPGAAARRALFGVIRTIENLIAKIFSEFFKLLSATTDGIKDGVKKGVSGMVFFGILFAAAQAAGNISPTAERLTKSA